MGTGFNVPCRCVVDDVLVRRININSSYSLQPDICTTHSYTRARKRTESSLKSGLSISTLIDHTHQFSKMAELKIQNEDFVQPLRSFLYPPRVHCMCKRKHDSSQRNPADFAKDEGPRLRSNASSIWAPLPQPRVPLTAPQDRCVAARFA